MYDSIKGIKYLYIKSWLRINLTKEQNLYFENYKTLLKHSKEELDKQNDVPCSWIGSIHMLKWQYFQTDLQVQCSPS